MFQKRIFKTKNKKGHSIVDTLMGILVFSIVLSASISGLRFSACLRNTQEENGQANSVLNFVIEDLHSTTFNAIQSLGGSGLTNKYNVTNRPPKIDSVGSSATLNLDVTSVNSSLLKILITINWTQTVGSAPSFETVKLYRSNVS